MRAHRCRIRYSIAAGIFITIPFLVSLRPSLFGRARASIVKGHHTSPFGGYAAQEWDCRIFGRVLSGRGVPIAGVVVTLEGNGISTTTGADGSYYFGKLRPGTYHVTFKSRKPGTREKRLDVTLAGTSFPNASGERKELNVTLPRLTEVPTPAPTIQPTPRPTPIANPTPKPSPSSPPPPPTPTISRTPLTSPSAEPSPTRTPENLETPAPSPVELSALDKKIAALPWGNFAFNVPDSIQLDELKPIQLRLSLTKPVEELKKEIREQGKAETERIQVSDEMEAILTGSNDAFNITEVLPRRRAISRVSDTEWKWDVRAVKAGRQRLHFIVNAYVMVDGVSHPYGVVIKEFDKEYEIDVPWKQQPVFAFVGNNWQWLWTAILIPIAGGIWGFRRQKDKKKARKRK